MKLDDEEIDLVYVALQHLRNGAENQREGTKGMTQVVGAAWHCCNYVAAKCHILLARIDQFQQDQKEEKAGA